VSRINRIVLAVLLFNGPTAVERIFGDGTVSVIRTT
jgi:hypothetical protein